MIRLPAHAARAIEQLEGAGFETWAVGGCVRDSLRGAAPHDWDLCTAARPEQMKAVFAGERVLETGLKHGTLTLLTDGGPLEITTFRADGGYSDGRHPDAVRFVGSVEDDLARRDFTVGAMAWHPARGLCDPYGGLDDLQDGILRAVGDPDARFTEDGLRILRAVRFASQLGFAVEPQTAAAMRRQLARLDCVAAERVREELTRTLCGRFVQRALLSYRDVLAAVLPELVPMFDCAQQNPHHLYDVWEHSVRAVGQVPAVPALRWAMLLHDCGKPACKTIDEKGVGHFYGHPKVSREIAERIVQRLRFSGAKARASCCWSSSTTARSARTISWCAAACPRLERRASATCSPSKRATRSARARIPRMWPGCTAWSSASTACLRRTPAFPCGSSP